MMDFFNENSGYKPLTIFAKSITMDVWRSPKYVSVMQIAEKLILKRLLKLKCYMT